MSFWAGFEKRSSEFYHRTDNLDKILRSGKIHSIGTLAKENPSLRVSVEPEPFSRERTKVTARKAYELMKGKKDVDSIFLTKGKPIADDSYGKYIIKKVIKTPKFSDRINFIPEEYKSKRPLSMRRTTEVYVPAEELEQLRKKYPKTIFKPSDEIKEYHPGYSVLALGQKLLSRAGMKIASAKDPAKMSPSQLRRHIASPAHVSGSSQLGLATKDSDVDIFVPFKRKHTYEKAKARIAKNYPWLKPSPYNKPGGDKFVLTSPEADVVLAYGPHAEKRKKSVERAKALLTPSRAKEIRETKEKLKKSWLFPETRYKRYKREVDKELGLYKW